VRRRDEDTGVQQYPPARRFDGTLPPGCARRLGAAAVRRIEVGGG
jgi:hypothetical protein